MSPIADMATPRNNHSATLLPNGKVLIAGGAAYGVSGPTNSAELYDPVADAWTTVASMGTAREGHKAIHLPSGRVQLVAGSAANGGEFYDPV